MTDLDNVKAMLQRRYCPSFIEQMKKIGSDRDHVLKKATDSVVYHLKYNRVTVETLPSDFDERAFAEEALTPALNEVFE